jgi:hypothetical protein
VARRIERHPTERLPELRRSGARDGRLVGWLQTEVTAAFSARHPLENAWREARRQYEGIPRLASRNSPIPNAPNIEITIGATSVDTLYAHAIDALFTASPLLVVRPTNERWVEHAKAMQTWVNWMAANELRIRHAVGNAFLDDVQLGTGAYYIPFVERIRKTDIVRVTERHPEIIPIAPENVLLSATSRGDLQEDRWVGLRFFYTATEVADRARDNPEWDVSKSQPIAQVDWLRQQREEMAHIRGGLSAAKELYEFVDIYCYYDYNEDGEYEDLLVTYDRVGNRIVALGFNPYDRRPIEMMRYQPRAHLPYGLGVMEMIRPYQEEVTEIHNHKVLNSLLANSRMYVASTTAGVTETMEVWPSKVVLVNDVHQFSALQMADVNPQLSVFEQAGLALAEQRVGLRGELSLLARGGNRTPATTALSLLQQANRRFTPAFDEMRLGTGAAVRQAIWRYSERVKARGDDFTDLLDHFADVLGPADSLLLIELLTEPDFEDDVSVEFTVASATVSREADRQNALLLANFVSQSNQRLLELMGVATNEQLPEALRKTAIEAVRVENETRDRLLRTFDQVRDPQRFIPDVEPQLRATEAEIEQDKALGAALEGMLGGGAPAPVAPPAVPGLVPGVA